MVSTLYFLFLLCAVGQGLLLPGDCPPVPATHFPENKDLGSSILHGVPFLTRRPSHIFKVYDLTHRRGALTKQNVNDSFNVNTNTVLRANCNITQYDAGFDQSLELRTIIHRNTEPVVACNNLIIEDVRIWFEGPFTVIWSCVSAENHTMHDEAVLIITTLLTYRSQKGIFAIMQELNKTARKYLSDSLLDTINWFPDIDNRPVLSYYNPFDCVNRRPIIIFSYYILALPLIIICGCLVVFRSCKLQNRVEPAPNPELGTTDEN